MANQENQFLLKNAKIYDGSGAAPFRGDILISGDQILEVAGSIAAAEDCPAINLQGLSIAPGFIDAHSHNDWFALRQDKNKFFEIYGSRPVSEGPAPERYRSATEYQITVLDERAGTDDDSFEYYLYTSTPEKYSPDRTYDVHRYIVEDNGWYITLSFLGDADVPQETVDEIVRSVKIGR